MEKKNLAMISSIVSIPKTLYKYNITFFNKIFFMK